MSTMASQITSLMIVYSTVYSGTDERKHQSSASLAFVRGIHRWPVNSPHNGPVMRIMVPFIDVIMTYFSVATGHCSITDVLCTKLHNDLIIEMDVIWKNNCFVSFEFWMSFGGISSWWRHQMETFSALLAICAGSSPVTGEFPAQRPVTRSFDVFFDLRPNKRLSEQSRGWWFETPSCKLWRHCNVKDIPYLTLSGGFGVPNVNIFENKWDKTGIWSLANAVKTSQIHMFLHITARVWGHLWYTHSSMPKPNRSEKQNKTWKTYSYTYMCRLTNNCANHDVDALRMVGT